VIHEPPGRSSTASPVGVAAKRGEVAKICIPLRFGET
jgi:hypothetical protein